MEQWLTFCEQTNFEYYAILVGNITLSCHNVITIKKLSNYEPEEAYKHAFAFVYPSIVEGFGYPPSEAMKYGTPVVCSNTTSLSEVYENAVLFFNPYYPEDLFKALFTMIKKRQYFSDKSFEYYNKIKQKQTEDFDELISYITYDNNLGRI